MSFQRRVSLPFLRLEKENKTPLNKSNSRKSLRLSDKSTDLQVVQLENFVDESLLTQLPVSQQNVDMPIFEEMPSVELEVVPDWIMTPRDFDEFRKEVELYGQKQLGGDEQQQKRRRQRFHKAVGTIPIPTPQIDWALRKTRHINHVMRTNSTNSEYQKFLLIRTKWRDYRDDMFPADSTSFLSNNRQSRKKLPILPESWKRMWYQKSQKIFPLGNIPQQGIFNTHKLLSAYTCLPVKYQMYLFQGQNFEGKSAFFVKLNKDGIWRYIIIDNLLPYDADGNNLLSTGFSTVLLEKAWAKHLGSFPQLDTIEHSHLSDIMADLTGAPSESFSTEHPKLHQIIENSLQKRYIVSAYNHNDFRRAMRLQHHLGIRLDRAYPIIRFESFDVILKNVWGSLENGPFYGYEQVRIPLIQLSQYFQEIVVTKVIEDGYYQSISLKPRKNLYALTKLSCSQPTQGHIIISQIDKQASRQDYSPCRVVLFQQNQKCSMLSEIENTSRKTNMQVFLQKNITYLLLIEVEWIGKQYDVILSTSTTKNLMMETVRYSPQNDYLLSVRKQKTQSEKLTMTNLTPRNRTTRSERLRK